MTPASCTLIIYLHKPILLTSSPKVDQTILINSFSTSHYIHIQHKFNYLFRITFHFTSLRVVHLQPFNFLTKMEERSLYSLVFLVLALAIVNTVHGQGTRVGFYSSTCPRAESIVKSTVTTHVNSDSTLAAGLLRMHFHDCFVQGCDASVLIAGSGTERTAFANLGLRGYEVIDDAKTQLEAACPGVVSCADILALAARDSVSLVVHNSKLSNINV